MSGDHAISRSTQSFAQMWTDADQEQSTNLDSGDIIGTSQRKGAVERLFLTCHHNSNEGDVCHKILRSCWLP